GRPTNLRTILAISQNISVPIELGGGVRDKETAQMYLDNGVSFIILGTVAVRNPPIALDLLQSFPGKIGIGIDAKNGRVAVQGWTEGTDYDAGELALKFDPYSPAAFIYTDIERDGMMTGPNFPATKAFAKKLKTQVILSGGVTSIDDIKTAIALENDGVTGIIIGRALYEGAVNLAEAISLTEGPSC
ncbi:MAG: HisA/HisF-related TIM barrel protein, partial [Desulfomonilaceae bacterium]